MPRVLATAGPRKGRLRHTYHYLLQRMNKTFCLWYLVFTCNELPVLLRSIHCFVYSDVIWFSTAGDVWESGKTEGSGKARQAIFKIPPKDATGETLLGDVGMLDPSLIRQLSKLVWQKRIQQSLEDNGFRPKTSAKNTTFVQNVPWAWDALAQELIGTDEYPKYFSISGTI